MKRVRRHLRQPPVRFHRRRHIKRLHRNLDLVKILRLQQADLPQRRGHHMIHHAVIPRLRLPGLRQPVHQIHMPGKPPRPPDAPHRRQAPEIHPDANGNVPFPGRLRHLPHLPLVPQVPRIQPQTIHPARGALQRQPVVKMNVRHQRNPYLPLDFRHRLRRFQIRHRRPDYLAPRLLKLVNLPHRGAHIPRIRLRHRLHRNVAPAAHFHPAHKHGPGNAPLADCHRQHRR